MKNRSMSRERQALEIMSQCPRYQDCSVPICPLDPLQDIRDYLEGEPRCTLSKNIRRRIGATAGSLLPHQGLTPREWSAKKRWDELPDAEKEKRRTAAKVLGLKMAELGRTGNNRL